MPLLIRRLLCLFFLNLFFCSLMGQTIIPIPGPGLIIAAVRGFTQPVSPFKPYNFKTTDAVIGIDYSDSVNGRYEKFSFIIENLNDLHELKETWAFKKEGEATTDRSAFKVYFTRNKEIKNSWFIFPESKGIATDQGYYLFDTLLLSILHAKSPLAYTIRRDTVSNKNDFLRFNDSVKGDPSFLFLIEPGMLYEGSFEVTIKAGSKIAPENAGERIMNRCDKIKPKTGYKVFMKEDNKTYFVRCNQSLFEQFADPEMEKSNWTPAVYIIKSYWRIK
jgi:hypothetical protein